MKGRNDLEVITKRPVAEHFKEGVVIGILANIIKVWLHELQKDREAVAAHHCVFHPL